MHCSRSFLTSHDIVTSNVKIYHYLSLDYFLVQLIQSKFYVKRKNLFEDINESHLPINLLFYPTQPFNKPKDFDIRKINEQFSHYEYYKDLSKNFVSSWTLSYDDYLMWKVYAKECGVCIASTPDQFLSSLDLDKIGDYNIDYGPVTYKPYTYTDPAEEQLFQKIPLYRSEREFRFIFKANDPKEYEKKSIYIPCDFKKMNCKIFLSPFFSMHTSKFLKETLKFNFGLQVEFSRNGIFQATF